MERGGYNQGKYYPCFKLNMDYSSDCDDYLISPALELKAGINYTISTITCSDMAGNGLQVSLALGTSASDVSTFATIAELSIEESVFNNTDADYTPLSVDEDGIYYIAFHATSPMFNSSTLVFNFSITGEGGGTTDPDDPVVITPPYDIDLRESDEGWSAADNNGDGTTWTYTNGWGVSMNPVLTIQHNDDYVSPSVVLQGGHTYNITANVTVQGTPNENDNVQLLQKAEEDASYTYLGSASLDALGDNLQSFYFVPSHDGTYRFALRNTSTTGGNVLAIYTFGITETASLPTEEEVIYETDFTGSSPLSGWAIDNANDDGVTWSLIDGLDGVTYNGNIAAGAADDWLISPAVNIVEGTDYIIEYTFHQTGAFDPDVVDVLCGETQNTASLTDRIASETIDMGSGDFTESRRFTADRTGNMYVGFHLTTSTANGTLSLTGVRIRSVAKAVPQPVTNLDVTSDLDMQTVTILWTNPTLDTNGTQINEDLSINITENGSLIHTLTGREAGADETYTFSPTIPFTGNVTYAVAALIGSNASEPVQQTICLDDAHGDTILVRDYTFSSTEDFDQWVIEDRNGGRTWEYEQYIYQLSIPMTSTSNNDWAITPGAELETGTRYVLTYELRSTLNYGADLDVTVGNAQTADAQTTVLESYDDLMQNGFGYYATKQFSVADDGTYYFGFHARNVENGLSLRNVKLMRIGEYDETVVISEWPYDENFDESLGMPDGWTTGGSSEEVLFRVVDPSDMAGQSHHEAHSAPNALVAPSIDAGNSAYTFTPAFAVEGGMSYEVRFWLLMPADNGTAQSLRIYALDEPNAALAAGTPLHEVSGQDIAAWTEQSFTYYSEEGGETYFMISVSRETDCNEIIAIDDFSFDEYTPDAGPSAPIGLRGGTAYPSSLILNWNYPSTDVDGRQLPPNTNVTVRFYDNGGYIGEQTGTAGSFGSLTYDYGYGNPDFAGQLIIKGQSYIADIAGRSANCIVIVSSIADGWLRETTYDSDELAMAEWTIVDGDNDGRTWTFVGDTIAVTDGSDEWLFSHPLDFRQDNTYYVTCDIETGEGNMADISFSLADGESSDAVFETFATYENLELADYETLELGRAFTVTSDGVRLAINAECNTGSVRIKNIKIYHIFSTSEPEAVPYTQDFEDRTNVDNVGMPFKWGRRTTTANLFTITDMSGSNPQAHSGQYAAVAGESSNIGRTETLYTPYFSLDLGGIYEISYWLYMPGNAGSYTYGNVLLSPTQNDEGYELPVIDIMDAPLDEWTKMTFSYTNEVEDTPLCFWFYFVAENANAGMIAIDDFSIVKTGQVGISETEDETHEAAYFINQTSTLIISDGYSEVTIYGTDGTVVAHTTSATGDLNLSHLADGVYVVMLQGNDKPATTIKIVK